MPAAPFDRRQFLSAASLASAALATGVVATLPLEGLGAEDPSTPQSPATKDGAAPSPIGLGFSLYGMKSLAVEKGLAACAEIGYDCVELAIHAQWPTDSRQLDARRQNEIRTALTDRALRLTGLMENLPLVADAPRHADNLERLRLAGQIAHRLAPDRPPVIETVLGGSPAAWERSRQAMADALADWARIAEADRTVICIKPHVANAMHRPEHVVWMLDQVASPAIRCAYDYSHFALRGIALEASIDALASRASFLHVKDERGEPGKFQFLLPGDGKTDYVRLLRLVAAAGYRGDVTVEVSGQLHGRPDYDPLAAARKCYAALAPAFVQAGVRRDRDIR